MCKLGKLDKYLVQKCLSDCVTQDCHNNCHFVSMTLQVGLALCLAPFEAGLRVPEVVRTDGHHRRSLLKPNSQIYELILSYLLD